MVATYPKKRGYLNKNGWETEPPCLCFFEISFWQESLKFLWKKRENNAIAYTFGKSPKTFLPSYTFNFPPFFYTMAIQTSFSLEKMFHFSCQKCRLLHTCVRDE